MKRLDISNKQIKHIVDIYRHSVYDLKFDENGLKINQSYGQNMTFSKMQGRNELGDCYFETYRKYSFWNGPRKSEKDHIFTCLDKLYQSYQPDNSSKLVYKSQNFIELENNNNKNYLTFELPMPDLYEFTIENQLENSSGLESIRIMFKDEVSGEYILDFERSFGNFGNGTAPHKIDVAIDYEKGSVLNLFGIRYFLGVILSFFITHHAPDSHPSTYSHTASHPTPKKSP